MLTISINETELFYIELFRIALSENNMEERKQAIKNVKQIVVTKRLGLLFSDQRGAGKPSSFDPQFTQWAAETAGTREEASYAFSQTGRRYEDKTEKMLNTAEHIGKHVWLSILDGKFDGVYTRNGILGMVEHEARSNNRRGFQDKDILRKSWMAYRGVAHLGMAIDYCKENPEDPLHVLFLAERIRRALSQSCPKGTSEPYVPAENQISFVYLSRLWGPRFQNRGLPFGAD